MLLLWLWGLVFAAAVSSVSSALRPVFPRFRDKRVGHLRTRGRPVSVSAKESPLHINRFPMNKHGHESTMIRRSTNGVYFVPDENIVDILNAKRGKLHKAQPEIQTIQLVFDSGDESDAAQSLEYAKRQSPIKAYDIESLLSQVASYRDNVKDLVREKHKKALKISPNYTNKKSDDSNMDDVEAMIKKALVKKPAVDRKLKKILLKTLDGTSAHNKKLPTIPSDVVEDIQTNALKEILGKVMNAGNLKTKATALDNWDRNSLYIADEKRDRAQSSPFNSDGMLYITKPKENKGPNLSDLLDKVANLHKTGPGRSHASLSEDFSPDEMQRIERISRAIENDDRTFEQVDKSIEHLNQQIERDDLAELQRFKDITAPKSVRSKDPESEKYMDKLAGLLRTDRDDKDPVFEFDTLVAK